MADHRPGVAAIGVHSHGRDAPVQRCPLGHQRAVFFGAVGAGQQWAHGVVVETMVALVLARAALEKFGGDSLAETQRNIAAYQRSVADREAPAARVSG